jgi:hypothetical protein
MLPLNVPAILGIAGSAVPFIFWIAVGMEIVFKNNFLMSHFFSPIDQFSAYLTILFLVVLPAIVLAVNFFFVFRFSLDKEEGEFRFLVRMKPRAVNLGIMAFIACNILFIIAYVLTENFMLVTRH